MRIAILGNSGSGKSTLARHLVKQHQLPMLELDDIVWQPGKIAQLRDQNDINNDLDKFINGHDNWVVEGCYGELVARALPYCTEFIFLNPGVEICLANNRRRPWEPHKYASKEAQDAMLENLLNWVKDYYIRDDQWSLKAHRSIFDNYSGNKKEVVNLIDDMDE